MRRPASFCRRPRVCVTFGRASVWHSVSRSLARALVRIRFFQVSALRENLDAKMTKRNDNKLMVFRQQATLVSRKLEEKEKQVEDLDEEKGKMAREIDEVRAAAAVCDAERMCGGALLCVVVRRQAESHSDGAQAVRWCTVTESVRCRASWLCSLGSFFVLVARRTVQAEMKVSEVGGAKFMTREEFKQYGAKLREKTHQYKKLKTELAELRAESVTLHRTEQILRGRVTDLDKFLNEQEARKGISGYRGVQDKLEKASEATAEVCGRPPALASERARPTALRRRRRHAPTASASR